MSISTFTIEDNNVWVRCDYQYDNDLDSLRQLLRYRPSGYKWAPSYKAGHWDGWISLVRHRQGVTRIPAGLLAYTMEQPWAQHWKVVDEREQPACDPLLYAGEGVKLDPHQLDAVKAAVSAGQGIVQYPTGTGKSVVLSETIRRLGTTTLVLVDKLDLVKQLEKELKRATGVTPGVLGGGRWDPQALTISTFQTLARRLNPPELENPKTPPSTKAQKRQEQREAIETMKMFDTVITDEGHHNTAKSFEDVLRHIPAFNRLAFSATAFKSYKRGKAADKGTFLRVQAFTGPVVAQMSFSEGLETGRIVRPEIFMVSGCDWDHEAAWLAENKDYPSINFIGDVDYGIVRNPIRNEIISRLALKWRRRQTVILISRIDHGKILADYIDYLELQRYGAATGATFLSGSSSNRHEVYERFRRKELKLLILSTIADEGLDLPNIEKLILAGGGKAPHKQTQRIGRGTRASEGKTQVTVVDFLDKGPHIGPHARRRRRTYAAEPGYTLIDISKEEIEEWLN